jgi:polysaccharide export outer membrane protein
VRTNEVNPINKMKLRPYVIIWCCLVAVVVGCRHAGPRFNPYPSDTYLPGGYSTSILFSAVQPTNQVKPEWLVPPTDFFRLGPGDIIDIEILGEAGSAATVLVGPDGKIYYSLLPSTFVWGLTLAEAKNVLEESLAKYILVRPEVALNLRAVASRRIWMLGNVQQPGIYTLATPMTVLEVVSAAGGIMSVAGSSHELADLRNSFVMRDGQMLRIDLERLFHQGDLSQNIYLQAGDYIYLRPAVSRDIYVLGAVRAPNIVPHGAKSSLVSAIATVDYQAIVKGKAPDVGLEPGDIIYVPFVPWQKVLEFAEVIMNEFVRTVALNEGTRAVYGDAAGTVNVSVGGGTLPPAAPLSTTP